MQLRECGGGDTASGMRPSGAMLVLFCCGLDKRGCGSCFAAGDVLCGSGGDILLRACERWFVAGVREMFCYDASFFAFTTLRSIK